MCEFRPNFHQVRVPSVDIAAGGFEIGAEIFTAGVAVIAYSTCRSDPGDAHPLTFFRSLNDSSDDLMTRDDWEAGRRSPPFDLIQLRVTDSAAADADQQLLCVGLRIGDLGIRKRFWILSEG